MFYNGKAAFDEQNNKRRDYQYIVYYLSKDNTDVGYKREHSKESVLYNSIWLFGKNICHLPTTIINSSDREMFFIKLIESIHQWYQFIHVPRQLNQCIDRYIFTAARIPHDRTRQQIAVFLFLSNAIMYPPLH